MSNGGGDDSLLELFTEEVRNNVQALGEGLVALEQDPSNATLIEPLMRAAHSIKGAARVVGVEVSPGADNVRGGGQAGTRVRGMFRAGPRRTDLAFRRGHRRAS